jgi:dCTP deaminase
MILSDVDLMDAIKNKRLMIHPFSEDTVRENGIDLRLADEIAHHAGVKEDFLLDPSDEESIKKCFSVEKGAASMVLKSGEHVLLSTHEYIEMPDDLVGFVELRSTWARHGLSLPPTIIDAGFKGTVTLAVSNNAPYSIVLKPKLRFAHIVFVKTSSRVKNPYTGGYYEQRGIKIPKAAKV